MQRFAAGFARRKFRVGRKCRDFFQKIRRNLLVDGVVELLRLLRIFLPPRLPGFFPPIVIGEQLLFVRSEIIVDLLRNEVVLIGKPESLARGIDKFRAGFAVRFRGPFHLRNSFSDKRVRNDELRFPVVTLLRDIERIEKLRHVLAVYFLHIESVSFETRAGVFALCHLCHGVERDGVGIVNQNQIVQTEMPGERARFRGNAFLQTAVARETDNVLIENLVLGVETRRGHFRRHGDADGVAHALSQRTRGAFDARRFKKFRDGPVFCCAVAGNA